MVLPLVDDLIGDVRDRGCPLVGGLSIEGRGKLQVLNDPVSDALLDHLLAVVVHALSLAEPDEKNDRKCRRPFAELPICVN